MVNTHTLSHSLSSLSSSIYLCHLSALHCTWRCAVCVLLYIHLVLVPTCSSLSLSLSLSLPPSLSPSPSLSLPSSGRSTSPLGQAVSGNHSSHLSLSPEQLLPPHSSEHTHRHTHTHTHTLTHSHTNAHTAHMYSLMSTSYSHPSLLTYRHGICTAYTHTHTCIHLHARTRTRTCTYTLSHIHVHSYVHAYICARMRAHTHTQPRFQAFPITLHALIVHGRDTENGEDALARI